MLKVAFEAQDGSLSLDRSESALRRLLLLLEFRSIVMVVNEGLPIYVNS